VFVPKAGKLRGIDTMGQSAINTRRLVKTRPLQRLHDENRINQRSLPFQARSKNKALNHYPIFSWPFSITAIFASHYEAGTKSKHYFFATIAALQN